MKLSVDFIARMNYLFSMPITISNVSGELKSEIGSLVRFYSKQKKSYSPFLNKGIFGTNLSNLFCETYIIAPGNLS